ncbi:hypothetical protein [Tateyamaria omphalii]|uniref:hypothetical protein n=1 Tax=Tateyamaria omphalii TaxID=299262 RepID=UPI0012F83780|nr:hypothetical protein [Tateyamaria omphalii]
MPAALIAISVTSAAWASCSPIDDPEALADLERFKTLVTDGEFGTAMLPFEISQSAKTQLVGGLEAVAPNGFEDCTTIKRVRQSDHFISEIFMTEADGKVLYWAISGQIRRGSFRMINFNYSDRFEDFRELMY